MFSSRARQNVLGPCLFLAVGILGVLVPAEVGASPPNMLGGGDGDDRIGLGMEGRPVLTSGGYFRCEFFYRKPNLYYGYDEVLGAWLPRGSPYTAFGLVSSSDREAYAEANLELTWDPVPWFSAYTDTSVIFDTEQIPQSIFEQAQDLLVAVGVVDPTMELSYQKGVPIPGVGGSASERPGPQRLQVNELYLSVDVPDWVSLTLGKRRVTWGSAFTWAPMDVVNPPFNPFEPSLLREGAYTAVVDLTRFYQVGLTLLYRPWVEENPRGLPATWDFDQGLFAARAYLNVFSSDLNLVAYQDRGRWYGGASFSRYFGEVEAHLEALVQRGRPTWLVQQVPGSTLDGQGTAAPYQVGQFDMTRCLETGDCPLYPDLVLGLRRSFDDGSFLLLEYRYHGAGYDREEYDLYRDLTTYLEEQLPHVASELSLEDSVMDEEVAQSWVEMISSAPFLYQEPNPRVHYLAVTFLKSEMWDLVEPRVTAVCNIDDGSIIVYPSANFWMSKGQRGPGSVAFLAGVMMFLGRPDAQVGVYPARFSGNLRLTARF